MKKRYLILENKEILEGIAFGCDCERVGELVFTTNMCGYIETLTDPSYYGQIVMHTFPQIGNYGIIPSDFEGKSSVFGYVVREYCDEPSNFRCEKTLDAFLKENGIPGISGIDTRKLTRSIREKGSRRALICQKDTTVESALKIIAETPVKHDVVSFVSSKKRWYSRTSNPKFNVVAVDCGIKLNIIRSLNARGCNVTVVPFDTDTESVLAMKPDGVFLSNGPGDPEDVTEVITLVKELRGKLPIFGICLGHQMISLAYGAKTYKLKFGHRGGNHPVKNLATGKIEITSQNHSYAVDSASVEGTGLAITHINLLDNTVEGVECKADKVFSVQYHPESAPGPQDSSYLFDKFIDIMKCAKGEDENA